MKDAVREMNLLADVFGGAWSTIASVFAEVVWVEEEIAAAKARWPEHAAAIDRLFELRLHCVAAPGEWPESLSRLHIRELAERIVQGKDLRPPTLAEMLYVLSEMSQEAPLSDAAFVLYARLFARAFPEEARRINGDVLPAYERTVMEEEVQTLHGELLRKLYQPQRILDEEE